LYIVIAVLIVVFCIILMIGKNHSSKDERIGQPMNNKTSNTINSPSVTQTTGNSQALQKVICGVDNSSCVFSNVVNNFINNCQPVEVTISAGTSSNNKSPEIIMTISNGENNSCRFQEKGNGVDEDCTFTKENITKEVIMGMLGDTSSTSKPEFQKIKTASCK
jgi:hypothetical protein